MKIHNGGMIEKYQSRRRDLYMIFIYLKKCLIGVPRDVLWRVVEKNRVSVTYIKTIQDMYDEVLTKIKTLGGEKKFPIRISLHQRSSLSP